jgi:hypothetical protein
MQFPSSPPQTLIIASLESAIPRAIAVANQAISITRLDIELEGSIAGIEHHFTVCALLM